MTKSQETLLENTKQEIASIIGLEYNIKMLQNLAKSKKSVVIENMKQLGLDKIELDVITDALTTFSVSLMPQKDDFRVDTARLKSVYNEIYNDCVKVVTTAEHIRIASKKK